MTYFVYALIDPRTDQPFYVGLTSSPGMRLSKHRTEKKGPARKKGVIAEIQSAGLQPQMKVLERVADNPALAREREQYWIQQFEMQGVYLTNVAHSVINAPVLVAKPKKPTEPKKARKRTKPEKRVRLTFDWMDAMWGGQMNAEATTVSLLDQLEKFISSFHIDETYSSRERRNFEIWCDCKRHQTEHPENFPFCNVI